MGKEKTQQEEIGIGSTRLLTCETYEAIDNYAPTMIFMDYKGANLIQKLFVEKYCPDRVDKATETNLASQKKTKCMLKQKNRKRAG